MATEEFRDAQFWDFRSEQFVVNKETGETLCVYGPSGTLEGGPFNFVVFEEDAFLVASQGDDQEKALHLLSGLWSIKLVEKRREGFEGLRRSAIYSNGEERWEEDARRRMDARALELTLANGSKFKGEWNWRKLAAIAGEQPWCLWASLPWVLDSLYGGFSRAAVRTHRCAKNWQSYLRSLHWDESHVCPSELSNKRKLPQTEPEQEPDEDAPSVGECCVTVPALVVVLARYCHDKRMAHESQADCTCVDVMHRATNLLSAIMNKATSGQEMAFPADGAKVMVSTSGEVQVACSQKPEENATEFRQRSTACRSSGG